MARKYWLVLAAALIASPAHAITTCNGNLFTNGSFETFTGTADDQVTDSATGWAFSNGTGGASDIITDANADMTIQRGTYAIALLQASSGVQTIITTVDLEANTTYTWTHWCTRNSTASIRWAVWRSFIYLQDDFVTWSASPANFDVLTCGSDTVVQKTLTFTTDNATTYTFRGENLFNNGDIFLDDFQLCKHQDSITLNGVSIK